MAKTVNKVLVPNCQYDYKMLYSNGQNHNEIYYSNAGGDIKILIKNILKNKVKIICCNVNIIRLYYKT